MTRRSLPVSPPQEHIQGSQWWTDYQPVSYTLTSKRGNRAQFQRYLMLCIRIIVGLDVSSYSMVSACHAAGVKVIAGESLAISSYSVFT